ncbi:MAG TPA: glycosyltransferase [Bryobacteraceae bacterium]|nr:glycosyltransferase [Bryobacteraceae bacterium]
MKPKIALVYIDSGGGHRAAAEALNSVIRDQQRPWNVQMLSIQNLLDEIDFIRKFAGVPFQDVYNIMLRHGWTLGTGQIIPVMHLLIRLFHDSEVEVLARHWGEIRPDLVVSLIPHYNRAMKEALERALPGTPFVTLMTDLVDYPPHFWIEPMDQHVICGSGRAAEQAAELGMPADRILRVSGMILHPRFYAPLVLDRRAERARLGLDPDRPTGLVLFGGEGSNEMLRIARALNPPEAGVQLILLCGRNQAVAEELRAIEKRVPMFVEGFTREVPYYMELADFFIGKPGPGSISEALAKRLPVIVQQNAWTMAHERYNAQWVEEQGVGIAVKNFGGEIRDAVRRLLEPETYRRCRERAAAMRNRAVYEIPDLLEGILASGRGGRNPARLTAPEHAALRETRTEGGGTLVSRCAP